MVFSTSIEDKCKQQNIFFSVQYTSTAVPVLCWHFWHDARFLFDAALLSRVLSLAKVTSFKSQDEYFKQSYNLIKMAVLDLAARSELCEDNNSKWKNTLRGKASTQEKPQWKAAVKVVDEIVFFINWKVMCTAIRWGHRVKSAMLRVEVSEQIDRGNKNNIVYTRR